MCSLCDMLGLGNSTLTVEDEHRLIDLQIELGKLNVRQFQIMHRTVSLSAAIKAETDKPRRDQNLVELARLNRNRSANELDNANVLLKMAKVAEQIEQILVPERGPEDMLEDLLGGASFTRLTPDDPRYADIMELIGAIGDGIPGLSFGRPMRPSRGSSDRPFSSYDVRNGSQRRPGSPGFPFPM